MNGCCSLLFSYSITLSSFLKTQESDKETFQNISSCGFKNIEMYGEPEKINRNYYKDMFSTFALEVSGITGMWGKSSQEGWKRRLLSRDVGIVKNAVKYVLSCIDLCDFFGGKVFNICLFSDPVDNLDVTHSNIDKNLKKNLLRECLPLIRKLSDYATERNIKLVLEPLNRYSTPYCCNYENAKVLLNGCDNLFLMLDTFHMNIEEDVFSDTIIESQNKLAHMHFADNNRKMPGHGHIDFVSIIMALKSINYKGFISFEPTLQQQSKYTDHIESGFAYIRNLERTTK
jgi:sugar phosphate isomerase/epimerase